MAFDIFKLRTQRVPVPRRKGRSPCAARRLRPFNVTVNPSSMFNLQMSRFGTWRHFLVRKWSALYAVATSTLRILYRGQTSI